jgi:hypothetical protein
VSFLRKRGNQGRLAPAIRRLSAVDRVDPPIVRHRSEDSRGDVDYPPFSMLYIRHRACDQSGRFRTRRVIFRRPHGVAPAIVRVQCVCAAVSRIGIGPVRARSDIYQGHRTDLPGEVRKLPPT